MKQTKRLGLKKSTLLEILMTPEISILFPLVILCVYTSIVNPNFLQLRNIQVILRYSTFIGTLAIGEAFVLMCGEIDLSVGTCSALASVIFASIVGTLGLSVPAGIILTLLVGVVVGSINSVLTLKFKMNAWITTISMQYVCAGIATVICKGKAITGLGDGIREFSSARPMGLSWMFFIMLAILLLCEIAVRFTTIGRQVHSVGLSVEAARVAGIHTMKVKSICFIFCSMMGAVCGILQTVNNVAANATVGDGNDFPAIICCVIGGVSNLGGKGSMLGVLLGVIMYQTLKNCLQMLGFNNNATMVLTGLILILAVAVDVLGKKQRQKRGK